MYTPHSWHNSIVVWLFGHFSWSSPSTKELHDLIISMLPAYHTYICYLPTIPTYATCLPYLHMLPTYLCYLPTIPTYATYLPYLHMLPTYHTYICYLRTCLPTSATYLWHFPKDISPKDVCLMSISDCGTSVLFGETSLEVLT